MRGILAVPTYESNFGAVLAHGLDGLVLMLHRGVHGWTCVKGHASLPGQTYLKDLNAVVGNAEEIVAVGLQTGRWVTVWALNETHVNYPQTQAL